MKAIKIFFLPYAFLVIGLFSCENNKPETLSLNDLEYLEMTGLNVMLAHDFYPEGHQGGVSIIQNGLRVATNGDIRLEPTPGQWQPIPKVGERQIDKSTGEIWVNMSYPDSSRHLKGFNPITYPDLHFRYSLKVRPEGQSFRIIVDLEQPLPAEWIGKIGFNMELFPGILYGKSYILGESKGLFHPQANGPLIADKEGILQMQPMATGSKLVVAPESQQQRMVIENLQGSLSLIDGRGEHSNGWFVVRSLIAEGATKEAVSWLITPNTIKDWKHEPVIQISQAGYHSLQKKIAVIELDKSETSVSELRLFRFNESGEKEIVKNAAPAQWGNFLRYKYLQFDFSQVTEEGIYQLEYAGKVSVPFPICSSVFDRNVWQPTLEYFLPIQMCHMRINDRYQVWHDLCHMDDARMAPIEYNHFDGYLQGPSTLTKFKSGDQVPGLNVGGWHDAGDYDLRVESQIGECEILSLAYEEFGVDYDQTTIDQKSHLVELHRPDGKNDILQQIEHGVFTVLGGYDAMGRLYRGIIEPTLRQYVLLGEAAQQTDNLPYDSRLDSGAVNAGRSGIADDRWVFTEENPGQELGVAAGLAASSRALKAYNPALSSRCLEVAIQLYDVNNAAEPKRRLNAAIELLLTTGDKKYASFIIDNHKELTGDMGHSLWLLGRVLNLIEDEQVVASITEAAKAYAITIDNEQKENPYGVPYKPNIWGAGWGIQDFGVRQYYLHTRFREIFSSDCMFQAMNFVLGCHPGSNNASFASGVGSHSVKVAYGTNRAEWSYIPGGVVSGTALIRPDYPELLEWPYLWQQTEYVMGGGATNFMFLVLGANKVLSN